MLTQARLKELLFYDKETGNFIVIKNRKGSYKKVGDIIGSKNKAGYLEADIDGKRYYLHRLAFLYMNGEFPSNFIDHINRNKNDNSWNNLRVVNQQQNLENQINPRKHGKFGHIGVYAKNNKFYAKINKDKKQIHLGSFFTLEEAANAYINAKKIIHTHFYEG